jgi:excisionase family DNA binding protein
MRRELPAALEAAIEDAAADAARAKRSELIAQFMISSSQTPVSAIPAEASKATVTEYATRERVSVATVRRWLKEGMPSVPVGTTVRIDATAADAWRAARGRKPTTPAPKSDAAIEIEAIARRAGLRLAAGAR